MKVAIFPIRSWFVILSVILLFGCASNNENLLYLRQYEGYWQVWEHNPSVGADSVLTSSEFDKRRLSALKGSSEIFYRNNGGNLFQLNAHEADSEKCVFSDSGTIKDYCCDNEYGYLLSIFAANALENIQLWWYSVDGKERRLLSSNPHLNIHPDWMPGGEEFVYVQQYHGFAEIYKASITNSLLPTKMIDVEDSVSEPKVSPNGRYLVFCRSNSDTGMDLWIKDFRSDETTRLFADKWQESEPSWSADSKWIYFSSWDGNHSRIAKVRPDGKDFSYVTASDADCRNPAILECRR